MIKGDGSVEETPAKEKLKLIDKSNAKAVSAKAVTE